MASSGLERWIARGEQHGQISPPRQDVVLAGCLALGVIIQLPWLSGQWIVASVISGLVFSVSLAWRRAAPVVPLLTLSVLCPIHVGAYLANGEGLHIVAAENLGVLILIYSIARWAAPFVVLRAAAVFVVLLSVFSSVNPEEGVGYIPIELGLSAMLMAIGILVRWRQANRVSYEQAKTAELQNTLANEIHDSVAHYASAIALRSEALLTRLGPDHDIAEDLRAINGAAISAVEDMRFLVSMLKDPTSSTMQHSTVGDIEALLAEAKREGLAVDLKIAEVLPDLPQPMANTVYRLVQESVTNTLRHAEAPTSVSVTLVEKNGGIDLAVLDDGKPGEPSERGNGFGLRSMSERVHSVGGTFSAGPSSTGGWLVNVNLPSSATEFNT